MHTVLNAMREKYQRCSSRTEENVEPQQVHGGGIVLLEPDEEGLIILVLASLPFVLINSVQRERRLLASSDKTVGGSCWGSSFRIRRVDNGKSST